MSDRSNSAPSDADLARFDLRKHPGHAVVRPLATGRLSAWQRDRGHERPSTLGGSECDRARRHRNVARMRSSAVRVGLL
jgi:hypothetical protein